MVLDQAQKDLEAYCAAQGDPSCFTAVDYFVKKRQPAEQACDLEHETGTHSNEACKALNELERLAREQMSGGSLQDFISNLRILQRLEERRKARGDSPAPASPPPETKAHEEQRAAYTRLFKKLDKNGDGWVSLCEFHDGAEAHGAVLMDKDMQEIADAMGEAGRLDLEEFIEVMQASPMLRGLAIGGEANFLRHASHVHGSHHLGGHRSNTSSMEIWP